MDQGRGLYQYADAAAGREIIFFPVLKISTWDVSLLKMLNMIDGKSNNKFAGSIQTALKQ